MVQYCKSASLEVRPTSSICSWGPYTNIPADTVESSVDFPQVLVLAVSSSSFNLNNVRAHAIQPLPSIFHACLPGRGNEYIQSTRLAVDLGPRRGIR